MSLWRPVTSEKSAAKARFTPIYLTYIAPDDSPSLTIRVGTCKQSRSTALNSQSQGKHNPMQTLRSARISLIRAAGPRTLYTFARGSWLPVPGSNRLSRCLGRRNTARQRISSAPVSRPSTGCKASEWKFTFAPAFFAIAMTRGKSHPTRFRGGQKCAFRVMA